MKSLTLGSTNLMAFKNMLKNIDMNENSIIIVPDKFSLFTEQMLFEEKNILANFSVRISSLTKLASLILENKLKDKKLIDKNLSLMIISSIIKENLHNFKYFKNIKNLLNFTEDIFNIISQILSSNVIDFNQNIDGVLKDKKEDLILILNEYQKRKKDILVDASKKFELFLSEIPNTDYFNNKNVYFGMFNSLTSQVKDIIKAISNKAKNVYFSASNSNNRVNNNEIFEFYNSLKLDTIYKVNENKNEICSFIQNKFFTLSKEKLEIENKIKLFEAKNIDDEIENLVYQIKKDILFKNYRFKDICVVVSNLEIYKDKIQEKFDENEFSYFMDYPVSLIDNGYAKFILQYINLLNDFKTNKLVDFIKNYYIDIDEKIKNRFENFIFKNNISSDRKLDEFIVYKNDEFYEDYLFVYDNFIKKIYTQIDNIQNTDCYQFFNSLNNILKEFKSKEKLNAKIDYYLKNDILKYKQYRQIEDKILECEKSICEFYSEEFSLDKIIYFLNLCFKITQVSVANTSVDNIFIGDAENSFYKSYKKVYVIGADSKNFPKLKQDVSLFNDGELQSLEKNKTIGPKVCDANKNIYFKTFESILNFEEELYISYSLVLGGNRQFMSNIFKNFVNRCLCFGEDIKVLKVDFDLIENFRNEEILNLLSLKLNKDKDYLRRYYNLDESMEKEVLKTILTNFYNIKLENEENDEVDSSLVNIKQFTASNLEDYFTCEKKFLFKNILKLKKLEQNNLNAKVIGNIVHNCCYYFSKKILDGEKVDLMLENKIIDYVFNKEEFKYIYYIENSKQIIQNLKIEILKLFDFIVSQQQTSSFKIKKVEHKFVYEVDGVIFKGFVDRIDETEDEFIIIDYKTGKTKIEYSELIFCKKIQLVLYAKILEKIINKKCKGIYYLNVNDDFSKDEKMKININGITLNSNNAIQKLDEKVVFDKTYKSNFFEFKDKFLLSESNFEKLLDFVFDKVLNAIKNIQNGKFDANPLILDEMDSCLYCDYYEICKKKNLNKKEFSEEILKEIFND